MTTKERSLSNLIIDKGFQFKFLGIFSGLFFITSLSLYSTTFLFYWNLKSKGIKVGIPEEHIFYTFLADQKSSLDLLFLGLALINFALLLTAVLVLTHRVAGPVQKIKFFLQNPEEAKEDFHLRDGDFFQELKPLVEKFESKK